MTSSNNPPNVEALLAHSDWVRTLARHMAHADLADDAEQEAWVIALERPPAHASNLRGWWSMVVRSATIRRQRSSGRRRKRDLEYERATAEDQVEDPSQIAARIETFRLLAEMVASLQEPYGQTVFLHYFEGLSTAQIADRQGVAKATVQSRLRRGVIKLREQFMHAHPQDWKAKCLALASPMGALPKATLLVYSASLFKGFAGALLLIAGLSAALFWFNRPTADIHQTEAALTTQATQAAPPASPNNRLDGRSSAPGNNSASTAITTSAAPPVGIKRDAFVEIHISHPNGEPWTDLPILLQAQPAYSISQNQHSTNRDGILRIPCISGNWELDVISSPSAGGNGMSFHRSLNLVTDEQLNIQARHPGWLPLVGKIFAQDGSPIQNHSIQVGFASKEHKMGFQRICQTDSHGGFSVEGIVGNFSIRIAPIELPGLRLSGTRNAADPAKEIEIQYPRCRKIAFQCLGHDGSPLADAKIHYAGVSPQDLLKSMNGYSLRFDRLGIGMTDGTGHLVIPAPLESEWPIFITHPKIGKVELSIPPKIQKFKYQIDDGRMLSGSITGPNNQRITNGKIYAWGFVPPSEPEPFSSESSPPLSAWRIAETNKNGDFKLSNLPESSRGMLLIQAPGFAYQLFTEVDFLQTDRFPEIQLKQDFPLSGVLRNADGQPLSDHIIHLSEDLTPEFKYGKSSVHDFLERNQCRTDKSGEFVFHGTRSGFWQLQARTQVTANVIARASVFHATAPIELRIGEGLDSWMNFNLVVLDAERKTPIQDFGVQLKGESLTWSRNRDSNIPLQARVHFQSKGNPVQPCVLTIASPGYANYMQSVPASAGHFTFQVELEPTLPARLLVQDSSGAPVVGMPVRVFSNQDRRVACGWESRLASYLMGDSSAATFSITSKAGDLTLAGIPVRGGYLQFAGEPGLSARDHTTGRPFFEIQLPEPRPIYPDSILITLPDDFLRQWAYSGPPRD